MLRVFASRTSSRLILSMKTRMALPDLRLEFAARAVVSSERDDTVFRGVAFEGVAFREVARHAVVIAAKRIKEKRKTMFFVFDIFDLAAFLVLFFTDNPLSKSMMGFRRER